MAWAESSFRLWEIAPGNLMSLHIYMNEIDFLCGLTSVRSLSLSLFFPLPRCVCLCPCRTLFYKMENIFPSCCKLLSNNGALSPAIIPAPPGQAQINGLLWRRTELDESRCYPGSMAAWYIGDGKSEIVLL